MNTALQQQQSLLLQALFGNNAHHDLRACLQPHLAQRGLQAYQANGLALAERALTAAYPAVSQLIGEDSFPSLAHHFWRQHPPLRGDMAEWGCELADFLDATPQLADEPFLGDVARVEWALHRAGTALDAVVDLPSFALLSEPGDATLVLSAGVVVLKSRYPVVSLVNAHIAGLPSLAEAAELLQGGVAEHALVWRQGFKPRVRASSAAEHALVQLLQTGVTLEHALAAALDVPASDAFDVSHWLGQAVQTGLVIAASAQLALGATD